jgi:hypothetical protein
MALEHRRDAASEIEATKHVRHYPDQIRLVPDCHEQNCHITKAFLSQAHADRFHCHTLHTRHLQPPSNLNTPSPPFRLNLLPTPHPNTLIPSGTLLTRAISETRHGRAAVQDLQCGFERVHWVPGAFDGGGGVADAAGGENSVEGGWDGEAESCESESASERKGKRGQTETIRNQSFNPDTTTSRLTRRSSPHDHRRRSPFRLQILPCAPERTFFESVDKVHAEDG